MQIFHREYWNCTGNTSIYPDHICDDEINDKKGEEDMLMILGFILLFLIMIIGGDRGVISLISLVGNMLLLSLAIWLMAAGAPVLLVTVGVGIIISCVTLFYQNGTNEKTKSAFTAVLITMAVLFFFIYMVVWRSEAGGLNEIQAAEDDVLYYNMNLDINMRNHTQHVRCCVRYGTYGYHFRLRDQYSQTGDETDRTCRKWNADRKRSNRDNGEYIAICVSWRITIIIFLSEDAGLYTGNIIKFENIVPELCINDIWCDRLCSGDAGCGGIGGKTY